MKKRMLFAALFILILLFAAGCGKSDNQQTADAHATSGNAAAVSSAENASDVLLGTDGEQIVFTVSRSFSLESDAWLGVIPTGTIYKNEMDADDVDIIYTYCDNLDAEGAENYRFPFDKDYFDSIEDGTYDLVLCSSDNAEIGKVLIQLGMEKKGDKIVLDYENKN